MIALGKWKDDEDGSYLFIILLIFCRRSTFPLSISTCFYSSSWTRLGLTFLALVLNVLHFDFFDFSIRIKVLVYWLDFYNDSPCFFDGFYSWLAYWRRVYLDPLQLLMFIIDKISNIIIKDSMFLSGARPNHSSILMFLSWDRRGELSGEGSYHVLGEGIRLICPFLGYQGYIH